MFMPQNNFCVTFVRLATK